MGQHISLCLLLISHLRLQTRASVMRAEAWEVLKPVDACIPVDRRYAKFNTDLCASIGLLPCMSVALTAFQFRMGLIAEAPNAARCFKLLSNFQSAFTCEYKHLKQFIFYEISTGNVYIDACTDACTEIWNACSPRSKSEYAYLFEAQDARRFCNSLSLPKRGVFIRHSSQHACLSAADFLQEADDGSSIASSYTAVPQWISCILRLTLIIILVVSLLAAYNYRTGQDARRQLHDLFSCSAADGRRCFNVKKRQEGEQCTELDLF